MLIGCPLLFDVQFALNVFIHDEYPPSFRSMVGKCRKPAVEKGETKGKKEV